MVLKQAELARRLGVDRSAISRAIERGKLEPLPDGTIDTDNPTNKVYLSKWSAHRGKHRQDAAPTSPGRAAAQLERARAEYARRFQDYIERKSGYHSTLFHWQSLLHLFEVVRAALPEFVDRIDWADPLGPEIAMERAMKWILEANHRIPWEPSPDPRTPPPAPPADPGTDLDSVRAARDVLAARRHDLERWIASGQLLSEEDLIRSRTEYIGPALNQGLLRYPRRSIASFLAVEYSQGRDAALVWLRQDIERECSRLDEYILRIKERLG